MYSLLLETYIKDTSEKNRLFNAVESIPCVTKKAKWALKWIERYISFSSRIYDEVAHFLRDDGILISFS